jgi:hypothetical protein
MGGTIKTIAPYVVKNNIQSGVLHQPDKRQEERGMPSDVNIPMKLGQ